MMRDRLTLLDAITISLAAWGLLSLIWLASGAHCG